MSILVVGISHNTAPFALLERVALTGDDGVAKLVHDVMACAHVSEAAVIATCNRLEVYADVDRFHGSVEELSRLLVERADEATEAMLPHLYVHYDDGAVAHLFQVAAGLDSMAVGEGQILGQTRDALRIGQELGSAGPSLNVLFQQALRVGKRARAETGIDRAAPTLVSAALGRAMAGAPGRATAGAPDLSAQRVVVVGAGAMAGLATATVTRLGAREVVVVNRGAERGRRLAAEYDVRSAALGDLADELAAADLVVACAGAAGLLITRAMLETALGDGRTMAVVDLALPRDVEAEAADLPGVTLVDLAQLAEELHTGEAGAEIADVRRIVGQEVQAFLTARRAASVTPTVVALRSMATSVVEAEMARLDNKLPGLDPSERTEVLHTLRRVADKLLHEPTVRIKELANETGAVSYAAALAELFALDPDSVQAVTRAEVKRGDPLLDAGRETAPEGRAGLGEAWAEGRS